MSSHNRFVFGGLEELKAELRTLPANLTGEASHDVVGAANGAAVAVRAGYAAHVVTGHLQDGVTVEPKNAGEFGVALVVKSKDPIAWLIENGSETRQYITVGGKKHLTGKMPGFRIFIPVMVRERRAMYDDLAELLERHGLRVSGEP